MRMQILNHKICMKTCIFEKTCKKVFFEQICIKTCKFDFHVLKKYSTKSGRNLQCFLKISPTANPKHANLSYIWELFWGAVFACKHANLDSQNPSLKRTHKMKSWFFFCVLDLGEGQQANFSQKRSLRFATLSLRI